jgi:hypothetical protein
MATGRVRRISGRGVPVLVLAWTGLMGGSFLLAPGASAATTVPVHIKDLTPPLVSVDPGDSVAFDDQIQDKTVQVGGAGGLLPSLVSAVVHTDVTLGIPDDQPNHQHVLKPGDPPFVQQFQSSCLTCTITYTYRVSVPDTSVVGSVLSTVTSQAIALMPQNQVVTFNGQQTTVTIGVPTPFIVNTLVPLPNLPSVNVPQLPQINVPKPGNLGGVLPTPGTQVGGGTQTITTTTTTTTLHGIDGAQYAYLVGGGVPQMSPLGSAARAAFDPSRLTGTAGSSTGSTSGGGAAGRAGDPGSGPVPVFALDGANLAGASAQRPVAQQPVPVPALIALVALAGVAAALVRTHRGRRASDAGH